jgi:hypothetical protein
VVIELATHLVLIPPPPRSCVIDDLGVMGEPSLVNILIPNGGEGIPRLRWNAPESGKATSAFYPCSAQTEYV